MNKLIDDIAKQCYETGPLGRDGWPEYCKFDERKFAKLIIDQCAEVINGDIQYQVDRGVYSNVFGLNQARELIKQHFGVEA